MALFSGQGKVYAAERDANGLPKAFKFFGNVPELKLQLSSDTVEHKESTSGSRVTDQRMVKENKTALSMTIEEFTADNLATALWGTSVAITGATVTNEDLPTGLLVGDYFRTKYPKISAVTTTPASVAGTDYQITSADHGMLKVLSAAILGSGTPKINYTYAAVTDVTMFTKPSVERWLRFEGLNTADSNKPVLIDLYRVIFDPMKDFGLINDEFAKWELGGSALYDLTKAGDAQLGGFGRVWII